MKLERVGSLLHHHVLVIIIVCLSSSSSTLANDILGCGGFVRSPWKIEFDKIEIKLMTKQGSVKLKTECAPTGYYFIPVEAKGDYILKISPPSGWTFTPSEVPIKFDGESDACSRGEDINFDFKGFSVLGKVLSAGFTEGPKGVTIQLKGPDGLDLKTESGEGGEFQFPLIPPGNYKLKASHPSLKFEKDQTQFQIINKNVLINGEFTVSGYDLMGMVKSDGKPVEKVQLVLVSADKAAQVPKGCTGTTEGISIPSNGKVLCVKATDQNGIFKFEGLKPGKYEVVPVYKGASTVYSVNPERMEVTIGHAPIQLPQAFEVEGFTVQGRVKGHPGAKILVNGQLKATSGHDGSFSIANMKPGTYDFEVTGSDKFLFEKRRIPVEPTNPVIPEFVPTRFQTCGTVQVKSGNRGVPEITLAFQKGQEILKERVSDLQNACVYLPEGSYQVSVESNPEKYFQPEKTQIQVPSGSKFTFQEFSGSISGKVICKLGGGCEGIKVKVESGSEVAEQDVKMSGTEGVFKFDNMESGNYRVSVLGGNSDACWKADSFDKIQLKSSNIQNLEFVQTGIPLEISSSHSTSVKILGKTPAAAQNLQLQGGQVKRVCLTDPNTPPESYRIVPEGCHRFEKAEYPFIPGKKVELIAKAHEYSWAIHAPAKIQDLKITRNEESFTLEKATGGKLRILETTEGKNLVYKITSLEEPGKSVDFQVFSYGFVFEPSVFTVQTQDDCREGVMKVVAKQSHVIKGRFSPPLEGIQIRVDLISDPSATVTVTSNSKGEYIAGPFIEASGFKVTPSLTGYTFKPSEQDPYSFTVLQLAKIQVKIQNEVGLPIAGVLLSISGPSSYRQNKIADDQGEMTFPELQPGQYYLKALLKEFQFQPGAMTIDLKEQEGKVVVLKAIRESFSLYGQLASLSGELMPDLLVTAKGLGNCSEYGEEGSSDEWGNFRIWALKSYCNYKISLATKDEYSAKVERTIPESIEVQVGREDIHDILFTVITPVRRMDVSLRCHTNNEKSLDHLKAVVYSSKNTEVPLHSVGFNGISYLILPPVPKDGGEYVITFESTLNRYQYNYKAPSDIVFNAKSAYAHFSFEHNVHPAPVDQEIGKNSYIAFVLVVAVVTAIANYERLGAYLQGIIDNYKANSAAGDASGKKSKSKTK